MQEHAELQEKYACLQDTTTEQEMALVELGKQLSTYVYQAAIKGWLCDGVGRGGIGNL